MKTTNEVKKVETPRNPLRSPVCRLCQGWKCPRGFCPDARILCGVAPAPAENDGEVR
jgi:hypothetical protein